MIDMTVKCPGSSTSGGVDVERHENVQNKR